MKLLTIKLDENENPQSISVEMSVEEAAFIAELSGRLNDPQADEVMARGHVFSFDIYSCLAASLFNRFYEDGVKDFLKGHR